LLETTDEDDLTILGPYDHQLVDSSGTMSGSVEAFLPTVHLFWWEGQASDLTSFFVLVSFVRIGKASGLEKVGPGLVKE